MTKWRRAILMFAKRKKIDSAAFFDSKGKCLAETDNFTEPHNEIQSVVDVLNQLTILPAIQRMRVFGDVFTVVTSNSAGCELVATSVDKSRMFVALKTEKFYIVAFSRDKASGSCLYEAAEFGKFLDGKGT